MSEIRIFSCPSCGHEEDQSFARCPACGQWFTPSELGVEESDGDLFNVPARHPAKSAAQTCDEDVPRIETGIPEFDRVLGGGIAQGSTLLVTGAPGVGKSTLLMKVAAEVAERQGPVLFVSAEEPEKQALARARRIGANVSDLFILCDNGFEEALSEFNSINAALLVIDSLQLMQTQYSSHAPGSAVQVKEISARLTELAKKRGTPILVAGQIVKTGKFAGPMSVPHMYDGVFHLDERTLPGFLLLRVDKYRFGSKSEVGSFKMTPKGIVGVTSPSAEILKGGGCGIITVALEGTKPIATEIQIGFLQRGDLSEAIVGYPRERLRLIQTILDQYGIEIPCTIALAVLGGYKINDPAADVAVAIAGAFAVKKRPVPRGWAAIGEVALDGRLIPPQQFVERFRELEILGIKNVIVPFVGSDALPPSKTTTMRPVRTLREALRVIGLKDEMKRDGVGRPKEVLEVKAKHAATKRESEGTKSQKEKKKKA